MEAGRLAQALILIRGTVVIGRPKVGTDWCGNVKSITEQIQHTLNAKVTAEAGSSQPCVGVAPRRSPASLDVNSQPGVDTQDDDDDEEGWRWWEVRRSSADQPLAHYAESAAAMRPVSGGRAGSQTASDQGRNVAEYPGCTAITGRTRDCECRGGSSVCWIYGWTD
jgi:hypothetical protein